MACLLSFIHSLSVHLNYDLFLRLALIFLIHHLINVSFFFLPEVRDSSFYSWSCMEGDMVSKLLAS